jgi:L-alanine-DL-glutamate epimerase-like enolase superfamily enzyme
MDTQILEARVSFFYRPFLRPLHISSGVISEITEARVWVRARVEGREAVGRGAIYLSDLWAWPEPSMSHAERDAALRALCERIAAGLPDLCGEEAAHPLELGMRLHESVCGGEGARRRGGDSRLTTHDSRLGSLPSALACAMCASPFDAAIHDAAGLALGLSAFDLYRDPAPAPTADRLFVDGNACAAIARMLRPPRFAFDAWLVVGEEDSLAEEVALWVRKRGYRAFKLKLLGRDAAADAARTVEVYRAVRQFDAARPRLSADSNGAYPDAGAAREYLERLRAADAEAFDALEYIEQPAGRDITVHRHDWHAVARLKPVLLDEGLTGPERMEEAAAQGWSGFALKTCKGHSFALVAAAWARERGLTISLQDLTNPGLAAIHAALFASRVPTLNGVELNSPQFTPAANAEWLPRMAALLDPQDGTHHLPPQMPPGFGSEW